MLLSIAKTPERFECVPKVEPNETLPEKESFGSRNKIRLEFGL